MEYLYFWKLKSTQGTQTLTGDQTHIFRNVNQHSTQTFNSGSKQKSNYTYINWLQIHTTSHIIDYADFPYVDIKWEGCMDKQQQKVFR